MAKVYRLFCFFCLLISTSVFAQSIMEYSTKEGETLKDVAEKYDVSYIKLLRQNRGVSRRPDTGTIIKVPVNPFVTQDPPKDSKPDDFSFSKEQIKKQEPVEPIKNIHIVEPKETLYGLSKKYGISIGALIEKNPALLVEGLKIGQELVLPPVAKVADKVIVDQPESKQHIVQPQETLYSLSKQYNISIDSLQSNNRDVLSNGLSIGDTLHIPGEIKKEVSSLRNNQHLVVQGETLYGISRKYGISLPELLSVNDTVVTNDMAIGTFLNLPSKVVILERDKSPKAVYRHNPIKYNYDGLESFESVLRKFSVTEDSLKTLNPALDSLKIFGGELLLGFKKQNMLFRDHLTFKDSIVTNKIVNLLLMLPFDLKNTKDLSEMSLFSNPRSLPSMVADFYLGAKVAVDSLLKQRVKVNFTVIDTEKSVDSIHKKIDTIRSYHPNLILGPLYTSNARYIASNFPTVPIYYPIYSKNQKSLTASNIIKTATNKDIFKKELISYIKRNRKGQHLVLVGSKKNTTYLNNLKNTLVKKDNQQQVLDNDVSVLALEKEYVSKDDFMSKIKLDKENWILVTENSNVITADVFNNSISIANDSIVTPIKILSYEKTKYVDDNVSYQNLAKFNYTYATEQVEYNDVLDVNFTKNYLKENEAYPNYYVERGFSVTYDAVLRFLKQGSSDNSKATQRLNQCFYYDKPNHPEQLKNENQSVFINTVCTEDNEIMIKRLQ